MAQFRWCVAVAAAGVLASALFGALPAAADTPASGPSLVLPDLASTSGRQTWAGYSALSTEVQTAPDPTTDQPVAVIQLVVPGVSQTVPAPAGGSGPVEFSLPTTYPNQVDGYVVAVDADGVQSLQVPVTITPADHSAQLTYDSGATHDGMPQIDGDNAHLTLTPTWNDGSTQTSSWLTDVTVDVNSVAVAVQTGLHAVGPITLDLSDAAGTALPSGQQGLTVCATDNHGDRQCDVSSTWVVNPVTASGRS